MSRLTRWVRTAGKTKMAVVIAMAVATLFAVLDLLGFGISYENKMLDLRFLLRETTGSTTQDKIILVTIDDQSLSKVKERWPWPRSLYAKAIRRLSEAGAKVVAFDFIFSEPGPAALEEQNRILGDAVIRSHSWIVMGSKFYAKKTAVGLETSYVASIPNLDPGRTHVGFVDFWPDEDGIFRHAALLRRHQGKLYHSFVLKILSRYYNLEDSRAALRPRWLDFGPMHIPIQSKASLLINFRGGPGSFPMISFDNLLDDTVFAGLLATGVFKDKIVLVGPAFAEAQDDHPTPYLRSGGLTSGVEIHANVLDTILKNKYLRVADPWVKVLIYYLLALGLALISVRQKPLVSFGLLLALVFLYGGLAIGLFNKGTWVIPMFTPMFLVSFGTYFGILAYLLATEERRSRHIKNIFSRYVSPKVVEQLVHDPNAELRLGGKKQTITVLFSDIRGFTTLSEQLPPEQVVELLNEYFQTWTNIIFKYDGMVDKFIGDAVMAIFGAPVAHADDPNRAMRAALDMKAALEVLNARWQQEGRRTLDIGVGINTGEAVVGNMGSQQSMGYTAIGDTVNLASRLESKTKDLGAFVLISESTYAALKDTIEVKAYADITVKGKAKAISVFEVLAIKPGIDKA